MGNIFKKLAAVQREVKATKDAYNAFGKYHYRSCESILEAVKPILAKHDSTIIISDDTKHEGDRYYIKAIVKFVDCETNETVEVTAFAHEEDSKKGMDGAQITGAASSYARKYALAGLLLLDDNKDPDAGNKHGNDDAPEDTKPAQAKPPKQAQNSGDANMEKITQLINMMSELSDNGAAFMEWIKKKWKTDDLTKLNDKQLNSSIGTLKNYLENAA